MTRLLGTGALVLLLAAGGAAAAAERSAAASAPTLSKVRVKALAGTATTSSWLVTGTARDADRDLVGGRVRVKVGAKVLSTRITAAKPKTRASSAVQPALRISSATLAGTALKVGLSAKAGSGTLAAKLWLTDTHGHSGNQVALTLRPAPAKTLVTIAATQPTAAEPSTSGSLTVTRSGSTAKALTVSYTVAGTAAAGTDYKTLPGKVTIPKKAVSAAIAVTPIDDNASEPPESVTVTLVAKTGYAVGSGRTATVTITDNDTVSGPVLTIVATDPSASEPSSPGAFTVTRTGSTSSALTVSYSVGGTATAGTDYTALPGSITIPAGSLSATITVTPLNDTATETSETVIATLVGGSGYSVGVPSTATVTITDAVTASTTVSISATDSSASEPNNPGTFTVSRIGSTASSLNVSYTVSGSATAGSDYSALSGSVTIPSGSSSATITVAPIDDVAAESDETVIVTLVAGSGYTVGLLDDATVTISDDDSGAPTVSVTATDASAAEPSDPGTFTVTRTGSKTAAIDVTYTIGGTATSGVDYTALSGKVTLAAGQASATIGVGPIDDPVFEGNETVVVTVSADPSYEVGTPASATVTIADNDSATVTIAATTPNAAEPNVAGAFTVTRTGDTSTALDVFYSISGTATNNVDYEILSGKVTIPAGASSAQIAVTPKDDTSAEGPETVILTLTTGPGYTPGTPSTDTVTIADND